MVHRIDVRTLGEDAAARSIRTQFAHLLPAEARVGTVRIFLIDSDADAVALRAAAVKLLSDPIVEHARVIAAAPNDAGKSRIEIHLKPGVMDPVAGTTESALREAGLSIREVRTGRAVLIDGDLPERVRREIASGISNAVIEHVHLSAFLPVEFEHGRPQAFVRREVKLCDLIDAQLQKLSREGHLFLSLPEMQSVQAYFRSQKREPSDVELETIAQTWSEHCVHKTLKSAVEVCDESGKVLRSYKNLIKETIFDSTMELIKTRSARFSGSSDFCLSVFKDNAGVIAFDEQDAVCFKVETHNHPSAIEPYGGAATGAGGCIRDVLGTGRSAKPIANTDIFCVANPKRSWNVDGGLSKPSESSADINDLQSTLHDLPSGVISPDRVLRNVVAGVRDYGNRMGIPTVNGAVYFDDRYVANPLVFCGCAGIIPRDKIDKKTQPGDAIVVMGGRTGRDGIHGATFSSAELTDTHADEFSHAVQIGNAITQKKMADVLLAARDLDLFSAVTDCGAGGLSSAVGEMAEATGATVELNRVPLKYAGLRYDEIWISEAQERMVLSVPSAHVEKLLAMCAAEDVEATVIGTFGTAAHELVLQYSGTEVGRLSMAFMHDGLPKTSRRAVVSKDASARNSSGIGSPRLRRGTGSTGETVSANDAATIDDADYSATNGPSPSTYPPAEPGAASANAPSLSTRDRLLALLASPNIASKHSIIRQYDHEVQGGSVIKPLVGPQQIGPSDAAVIRPKLSSRKGVILSCGMAPHIDDPYAMAIASIDEAIRNAVCVGASLNQLAILDNFCWPSVDDEYTMGTLVRACEACRDAALAYGVPFISGKDSLHNQFTDQATGRVIRIPRTLLISAIGVIDDVNRCVTMDLKGTADSMLWLVTPVDTSLASLRNVHASIAEFMADGSILSCHDVSDGGPLVAAAEMCIASGIGLSVMAKRRLFDETLASYLIELPLVGRPSEVSSNLTSRGINCEMFGMTLDVFPTLILEDREEIPIADLIAAWRGTPIV